MMLEPHDSFVSADRNNSHLREFHVDLEPPPLTHYVYQRGADPEGDLAVICAVLLLMLAIATPTVIILVLLGVIHA